MCCCRRCISACRWSRASSTSSIREEAFRADGRARGAQRLHAADGAAHAARGRRTRAGATTSTCAPSRSAASRSGRETYAWGREALGLTINEFYGQTECNLVLASCAAIGVAQAGRDRQAGARPRGRGDPRRTARMLRAGRARPDRGAPARSGDVPGLLEQARRRRADKFVGDWMTTGDQGERGRGGLCPLRRPRRRRHHLGGLPHRPGRDRGLPDRAIPRSRSPPRSASPIRCAPRSSRPSWC